MSLWIKKNKAERGGKRKWRGQERRMKEERGEMEESEIEVEREKKMVGERI